MGWSKCKKQSTFTIYCKKNYVYIGTAYLPVAKGSFNMITIGLHKKLILQVDKIDIDRLAFFK